MRISDWSSDVCSSDLIAQSFEPALLADRINNGLNVLGRRIGGKCRQFPVQAFQRCNFHTLRLATEKRGRDEIPIIGQRVTNKARSEEHTSELQSLMRISYAVFCLKKKNKIKYITRQNQ